VIQEVHEHRSDPVKSFHDSHCSIRAKLVYCFLGSPLWREVFGYEEYCELAHEYRLILFFLMRQHCCMIDIKLCGPLWERDQTLSALSERLDQTKILSAPAQTPHSHRIYFRPGTLISNQFDNHSRQNLTY